MRGQYDIKKIDFSGLRHENPRIAVIMFSYFLLNFNFNCTLHTKKQFEPCEMKPSRNNYR